MCILCVCIDADGRAGARRLVPPPELLLDPRRGRARAGERAGGHGPAEGRAPPAPAHPHLHGRGAKAVRSEHCSEHWPALLPGRFSSLFCIYICSRTSTCILFEKTLPLLLRTWRLVRVAHLCMYFVCILLSSGTMLFSELTALSTPQLRSQVRDLQPQLQFDDPINIQVHRSFCTSYDYCKSSTALAQTITVRVAHHCFRTWHIVRVLLNIKIFCAINVHFFQVHVRTLVVAALQCSSRRSERLTACVRACAVRSSRAARRARRRARPSRTTTSWTTRTSPDAAWASTPRSTCSSRRSPSITASVRAPFAPRPLHTAHWCTLWHSSFDIDHLLCTLSLQTCLSKFSAPKDLQTR